MGSIKPSLLVVVLLAGALAGCTDSPAGNETLTEAAARDVWTSGFANVEDLANVTAFGANATASANGTRVFLWEVAVRPGAAEFLLRIDVARKIARGQGARALQGFAMGSKGIHYILPDLRGNLSLRRDHVPDAGEQFSSFEEMTASQTGFTDPMAGAPSLGPDFGMVGLNDKGREVNVTSAEATTWKGRDAWRIAFTFRNATLSADGEMIVYDDPRRPAHAEFTVDPAEGARGRNPVLNADQAEFTVDFTYDDEVQVTLPKAERAPPLLGTNETESQSGRFINGTVSPDHDDEVPLEEVEIHLAPKEDSSGFGQRDAPDVVYLELPLDEGSAESDDFRATFDDADGDGFLSANDTYQAEVKNEHRRGNVSVLWWDTWSGKYTFQPGFEVLGVLAAVALAAVWAGRRKES